MADHVTSPALQSERLGNVVVLHLDDGKANALSAEFIAAIRAEIEAADADPEVGAVVLHGREGRFCAGFDLGVMSTGDINAISSLVSDGGDLMRIIYGSGVPIVAACTGHALAAGALLLLACDLRLGADIGCKIGLNEVAIKMVLPSWAVSISVERLSRRHLQRSLATARLTGPAEAVDAGFLDEVVAADEVLDVAIQRATEMAESLDRRAYAGTVRALRGDLLATMERQIAADRSSGSAPTG